MYFKEIDELINVYLINKLLKIFLTKQCIRNKHELINLKIKSASSIKLLSIYSRHKSCVSNNIPNFSNYVGDLNTANSHDCQKLNMRSQKPCYLAATCCMASSDRTYPRELLL